MRKLSFIALTALVAVCVIRAADWPSQSGNPQRDGWAKAEKAFTKENAGKIELLYKYKAENQARGLNSVTTPVVNGFLISHQGFKEMLAFAGSGDTTWSVDADLNRIIWKTHLDYKGDTPQSTAATSVCPGGLTAGMTMPGSSTAAGRGGGGAGRGRAGAAPGAGRGPAGPPPPPAPPPPPQLLGTGTFGRGANFATVASDGTLHILNANNGAERIPAIRFVPPNARLSALNIANNIVYAATLDNCGGAPNAIHALDLSAETPAPVMFQTNGASAAGAAGTAIAADGTVFAQIPDGKGDVAGVYNDTVVALAPDLKVKNYFTPQGTAQPSVKGVPSAGATPVVFTFKGRELVVAAGRDGRAYLLEASSLGGADHHTPLSRTEPIATPEMKFSGTGFQGAFASSEDDAGVRWVFASVWGPATAGIGNGKVVNGAVVAFQVTDQDGKPALTPKWTSRDLQAPAPVVTANGLVFALATGQSIRAAKETGALYTVAEKQKAATKAVLCVLDAETGKELYSSGAMTATFSTSGLAVANRRIYFTTHDNLVYSLGFLAEQPQLTGK